MKNNKAVAIVKGVGIGMAVGGGAMLLGSSVMKNSTRRKTRRNSDKAMRTMSNIVGSLQTMMKI